MEIDTIMPCSTIMGGTILDYIMDDQFVDEDVTDSGNIDLVVILNGTDVVPPFETDVRTIMISQR